MPTVRGTFLWLALITVLSGCGSRPGRSDLPEEEQPIVKSAIAGMIRIPRGHRAEGIEVNVADDPTATEALRVRLSKIGYRVVAPGEQGRYQLQVAPTYIGPEGSRPAVGTAETQGSGGIGRLLGILGSSHDAATVAVSPAPIRGVVALIVMTLRASGVTGVTDRPIGYVRRVNPVDALVMRMVLADGQRWEQAEILTQSYAEKVPPEALVEDSVRTMVWLLE
jgi:hypothetical protein